MVTPDLFNEVPLFQLLDAEERRVLTEQVSMRKFRKGELIFQAGDPGGLAYLIQKGMIHVMIKDANYENIIVDIADDGGLVGMSSLLAGEKHQTTAIAMEDTTAIEIDRHDIAALLEAKPLAGLDMMTIIEKQLRAAHELMRTRVARNVNEESRSRKLLARRLQMG